MSKIKIENYTTRVTALIESALEQAKESGCRHVNFLHLFYAFLDVPDSQVLKAFYHFGVDLEVLESTLGDLLLEIDKNNEKIDKEKLKPVFSKDVENLLESAQFFSEHNGHDYVGIEHIFVMMFDCPDKYLQSLINQNTYDFEQLSDYVSCRLADSVVDLEPNQISQNRNEENQQVKLEYLSAYGTNINNLVSSGKITGLFVDEKIVNKVFEILCRKNKNNPLIVGEAGVGKTALVECIAKTIVDGKCSDLLRAKQIYSIDVAMIVAGGKYRGEFEEKIKGLLQEVASVSNVILFIDEIHTIIGAGNSANGLDAANILKPYLARGDISCIGATTFDEYKNSIASDSALERRFQVVKLEEPSPESTLALINNIKHSYEEYHSVSFSDDIVKTIVKTANQYVEGRFPDKALDILDQAGAKVKLRNFVQTDKMKGLESGIKELREKPVDASSEKNAKDLIEKYKVEVKNLIGDLRKNKAAVLEDDVLSVISDKSQIPIDELKKQDNQKLADLKIALQDAVVGQDSAIEQVFKSLIGAKAGFLEENRPKASFLFAGPSGVGQKAFCKAFAKSYFLNKNNFIHIDLSEYTDKISVNKLVGTNAGYIGFEKGGILTEKVKRNQRSLVLFDNIDKADSDVLSLISQILENGSISDGSGKNVRFNNCIIILTTNVISGSVSEATIGFGRSATNSDQNSTEKLKKILPSEFLNNIDEIVYFVPLKDQDVKKVIDKHLSAFKNTLELKNIILSYSNDVNEFIFNKIRADSGAIRQISNVIEKEIQGLVAEKLFNCPNLNIINLKCENGMVFVS